MDKQKNKHLGQSRHLGEYFHTFKLSTFRDALLKNHFNYIILESRAPKANWQCHELTKNNVWVTITIHAYRNHGELVQVNRNRQNVAFLTVPTHIWTTRTENLNIA